MQTLPELPLKATAAKTFRILLPKIPPIPLLPKTPLPPRILLNPPNLLLLKILPIPIPTILPILLILIPIPTIRIPLNPTL